MIRLLLLLTPILFCTFFNAQSSEFIVQTGHSSEVNKLEFNSTGNLFASAGYDNNIVLWEVETGKQLRLLSGHTDQINDLIFIKSDSILVSCSNDSTVKFWNTYTGQVEKATKTDFLPKSVSYNKNSKELYIAAKILYKYSEVTNKTSIIKSPKSKPYTRVHVLKDGSYIYGGDELGHFYHKKDSTTIKKQGALLDFEFSEDEKHLITITDVGNLLSFELSDGEYKYKKTLQSGYNYKSRTNAIAFSDTNLLCLGRDNTITLVHANTGNIDKFFMSNYYEAKDIAIHPDGKTFISCANDGKIYLWDIASGTLVRDFKSNSSAINVAKFSNDNRSIVLGYNSGLIRIWDLEYGGIIDTHKFRLSSRQEKQGWRYQVLSLVSQVENTYTFKVALTKPYKGSSYYKECRYYDFVWNIKTNTKTFTEKFVESHEPLSQNFQSIVDNSNRSFQNDTIFMIAEGKMISEYRNDKPQDHGFETPHSNDITSLDYSLSKNLYLTASWDGQILLYNKYGKVILRLAALQTDDFVMINPQNYYYATKGSLPYIGFTEGHKSVSFQQYDIFYNRPDKVYASIPFGNPQIIENLEKLNQKRLDRSSVNGDNIDIEDTAPEVFISSVNGPVSETNEGLVGVKIHDNYGVKHFSIKIDGVPVYESDKDAYLKNDIDTTISLKLQSGINKIDLIATNTKNIASIIKTTYIKSNIKMKKPNLYFVGIGASKYKDTTKNLKYAQKDIEDITKTIKKSKVYQQKYFKTFFNEAVSKDSLAVIDQFLKNSTVNDVVIVYYAGHGLLNKDLDYFLASYDNDFYAPELSAIPYNGLEQTLLNCESRKKLLFLDACHSGELDEATTTTSEEDVEIGKDINFRGVSTNLTIHNDGSLDALKMVFADLKENNGITVISSAGGADYAIESDIWENGAFTYCMIEGLKSGDSDLDHNGVVTVSDMLKYLQINVPILTNGYQLPTYRTENIENDFIIWKK
jgi:WD40 repeat protein